MATLPVESADDITESAPRKLPENKDAELRAALQAALASDRGVLVAGTMCNKKDCPTPPGLRWLDEKELTAAKTLPTSSGLVIILTSTHHKTSMKLKANLPEGTQCFDQVSVNQVRRALKNLGYTPEPVTPAPVIMVEVSPPPEPAPQPKRQHYGIKLVQVIADANADMLSSLEIEGAAQWIAQYIHQRNGKVNPKTVRSVLENQRSASATDAVLRSMGDDDQELGQLFKELDRVVNKLKQRLRAIVEERNQYRDELFAAS